MNRTNRDDYVDQLSWDKMLEQTPNTYDPEDELRYMQDIISDYKADLPTREEAMPPIGRARGNLLMNLHYNSSTGADISPFLGETYLANSGGDEPKRDYNKYVDSIASRFVFAKRPLPDAEHTTDLTETRAGDIAVANSTSKRMPKLIKRAIDERKYVETSSLINDRQHGQRAIKDDPRINEFNIINGIGSALTDYIIKPFRNICSIGTQQLQHAIASISNDDRIIYDNFSNDAHRKQAIASDPSKSQRHYDSDIVCDYSSLTMMNLESAYKMARKMKIAVLNDIKVKDRMHTARNQHAKMRSDTELAKKQQIKDTIQHYVESATYGRAPKISNASNANAYIDSDIANKALIVNAQLMRYGSISNANASIASKYIITDVNAPERNIIDATRAVMLMKNACKNMPDIQSDIDHNDASNTFTHAMHAPRSKVSDDLRTAVSIDQRDNLNDQEMRTISVQPTKHPDTHFGMTQELENRDELITERFVIPSSGTRRY